jgi:lipopolysaccharide transport system permease protein
LPGLAPVVVRPEVSSYEIIIEPSRGIGRVHWRELWEYRDLVMLLVRRDFSARYRQTLLGPLWHLVQPLLTTLVFAVVFARIAGIPTDGIPAPLFYLCGLLGWNCFSQTVTQVGLTFVNNSHLFGKVFFPRMVVPLATSVSNLLSTALQIIPLVAFFVFYRLKLGSAAVPIPEISLVFAPAALGMLVILALGIGLWMAALTTRYRDLAHLNQFIVQLGMFASPVIFPISAAGDNWRWLLWANPIAAPLELLRFSILGKGATDLGPLGVSLGVGAVLLITGIIAFQSAARTATDHA